MIFKNIKKNSINLELLETVIMPTLKLANYGTVVSCFCNNCKFSFYRNTMKTNTKHYYSNLYFFTSKLN